MTTTTEKERVRHSGPPAIPAVLTYAFRPMFIAAGSWAIVAIVVWFAMLRGYLQLATNGPMLLTRHLTRSGSSP